MWFRRCPGKKPIKWAYDRKWGKEDWFLVYFKFLLTSILRGGVKMHKKEFQKKSDLCTLYCGPLLY